MHVLPLIFVLAEAVAAQIETDEFDEACALQVHNKAATGSEPGECAICSSCGGSFPQTAGRATYFQTVSTEWHGFGEECSGGLRSRTGDSSVIYSAEICCKSESQQSGAAGACAICDSCDGSDYSFEAGAISWADTQAFVQNYEGYEGKCSKYYGSKDVEPSENQPSGKLCCKPPSEHRAFGKCALCAGSCGGQFTYDGGYLPYAVRADGEFEVVKFTGYATSCQNSFQEWQANSLSFLPKICCSS